MRIAFYGSNILPIHAKSLDQNPLGGTETGLIRLAEALQNLGHDVIVFTPMENPPESKPRYLPARLAEEYREAVDVFVVIRDWIPIFFKIPTRRRFVWLGDNYDKFFNFGIGDKRVADALDALLTVSDWQGEALAMHSGFPREKCWKLGNGINPDYFEGSETRVRKRLIFSSAPYQGLKHLPRYVTELRKKHSDLECHTFSTFKVYGQQAVDPGLESLLNQLRATPGIVVHDSILQKDLAREFMKSSLLFYPNEVEESCCITAMEAMAAGTVVLSSRRGALPETVGEAGILIDGNPGEPDYDRKFLLAADVLLSDETRWNKYSQLGLAKTQENSWAFRAQRFVKFVAALDQ